MSGPEERQEAEPAIAAYKRLLRAYLDRRPSGTRQKLASALGTHKSFVSQVANPAYRVPLPAQHVETIMRLCHFAPEERSAFVAAYRAAHPGAALGPEADAAPMAPGPLTMRIEVPALGDAERQRAVAETIRELAARIIALAETDRGGNR